jgi:diguanylate cyclase (GGDEF)-like protein
VLRWTSVEKWRTGAISRAIVAGSVALFNLTGVIHMDWTAYFVLVAVATLHLLLILGASPQAWVWLDWFNPILDLGIIVLILQLTGRAHSPLTILVYLWWFAMLAMNAHYSSPWIVGLLLSLGGAALALGGWGDPGWATYAAVHAMGVLMLGATALSLMGERHRNRMDPLTQVLNRGAGLERLALRARHHEPFDLAFVDLKGFKRINDDYGHAIGDEVLRSVAGRLLATVRPQDLVIRYGGDEFLVVGPKGTLSDRIRRVFEEPIATSMGRVHLAGDHGVVTWEPRDDASLESLLARADAAMYRMKYTEFREDPPESGRHPAQRAGV